MSGRFFVTGAGGFLGARLVRTLERRGNEVVAASRAAGFDLLRDELPIERGDHVFHLAGSTGVPASWDDPVGFHLVNAHGTVRVLDACRRARASLTYVGAYTYGFPKDLPISERHPLDPNNPYAFSKWMGEEACRWFSSTYSLPVTAIRLFNVYGAGQSDRFVVAKIVGQALDPAVDAIDLMDLRPRRDYLYVDDAIESLVASMPTQGFQVFNVGSGVSNSLYEVVDAAFRAVGSSKPVRASGEVRPNEIPDVRADCGEIARVCGWRPRFSLVQGVDAMVKELRG